MSEQSYAIEVPFVLTGESGVKSTIQRFREQLSVLIAQAGGESRLTLIEAFRLLDGTIKGLEIAYGKGVQTTFKELDKQQVKVFEDTNSLLAVVGEQLRGGANGVQRELLALRTTVQQAAVWIGPVVTGSAPDVIGPLSEQKDVRITIRGIKLNLTVDYPATLDLDILDNGRLHVKNLPSSADEIEFVVKRSKLPVTQDEPIFLKGTLTLQVGEWCIAATKCLSKRSFPYSVLFTVLPEKLGTYSQIDLADRRDMEIKDFSSKRIKRTNYDVPYRIENCVNPEKSIDGFGVWLFDLGSADLKEEKQGWYRGKPDPRYNHGGAGYIAGKKTEEEICFYTDATIGSKESEATTYAQLFVKQYRIRTQSKIEKTRQNPKELLWNSEPMIFSHTNDVQLIHMRFFNQENRIFNIKQSNRIHQLVSIEPNSRDGITIINIKQPWK